MHHIEAVNEAVSFELSPVKYDFSDGVENCSAKQHMVVCDPIDAVLWSVYARQPDRTVVWLHDAHTQSVAVDFIRTLGKSVPIYLATATEGFHGLTRMSGRPSFVVWGGTTGDNGVFKKLSNPAEYDRWVVVAIRPTGDKSYTYVELGSHNSSESAHYALSAILNLGAPIRSHFIISPAARVPQSPFHKGGIDFLPWYESGDGLYGLFSIDTANEAHCVYTSHSVEEIVAQLNAYNDLKTPVLYHHDSENKLVSGPDGVVHYEDLKKFMA